MCDTLRCRAVAQLADAARCVQSVGFAAAAGEFSLRHAPAAGDEPVAAGSAREHHTYDLLRSDSGFMDAQFSAAWQDVFVFRAAGAGP